ncbi:hypothetical protein [Tateyamaria sp.]|uniref:hypothetical protein n=1 Tax=Tateyamaria sp. TaxID=1929288 RepID=UPI00329C94F1
MNGMIKMTTDADAPTMETNTSEDDGKAEKRAARLEKLKKAETLNFAVDAGVRAFLARSAKAQGLDLSHMMQKIVEGYIIDSAPKDSELSKRLTAKRAVIDMTQNFASEMDAAGQFDDHFILNVLKKAASNPTFAEAYATATGAANSKKKSKQAAHRARTTLNQQLGRVIKRTVGAKSLRNDTGRIVRSTANDALISTYTLLTKAAPAAA